MKKLVVMAVCFALAGSTATGADGPAKYTFEIGPEFFTHKYKEPGLMEQKGNFYGVAMNAATHEEWMWAAQLELAGGKVDYDGALVDFDTGETTPYKISDISDWMVEGRVLLGPEFRWQGGYGSPYVGLGYRWLWDKGGGRGIGGYDRAANYFYVPLGGTVTFALGDGWSLCPTAEYDYFIFGEQISKFSDIDPGFSDLTNRQTSGHGWRASLSLEKDFGTWGLKVQPFVRYWKIGKSKTVEIEYEGIGPIGIGWEPKNETREAGVQVFFTF